MMDVKLVASSSDLKYANRFFELKRPMHVLSIYVLNYMLNIYILCEIFYFSINMYEDTFLSLIYTIRYKSSNYQTLSTFFSTFRSMH